MVTPPLTVMPGEHLRQATRSYVEAAFKRIREHVQPRLEVSDGDWEWVRASAQAFRLQPKMRLWWQGWAAVHSEAFEGLPERAPLVACLMADPEISPLLNQSIGTAMTSHHVEERHVTDRLIWEVGSRSGAGEFDLAGFDEAYDAWNAELRGQRISHVAVAPLWGFEMNDTALKLDGAAVIERLGDEEIARLLSVGIEPAPRTLVRPASHLAFLPNQIFALRIIRESERIIGGTLATPKATSSWAETNDTFEDVLIALRLFKQGRVAAPGFAEYYASWPLQGSTALGPLRDFPPPTPQGFGYSLSADDPRDFQTFFASYRKAKHVAAAALAFRRFAYASDRYRPEDQIIDLMIAAEALFLPAQSDELSYRLSLRGAHFLQSEATDRLAMFRFLKRAYRVRSGIAHGSRLDRKLLLFLDGSPCETLQAFSHELERVLRLAMRKAVDRISTHGAFFGDDDWDALVVGAGLNDRFVGE